MVGTLEKVSFNQFPTGYVSLFFFFFLFFQVGPVLWRHVPATCVGDASTSRASLKSAIRALKSASSRRYWTLRSRGQFVFGTSRGGRRGQRQPADVRTWIEGDGVARVKLVEPEWSTPAPRPCTIERIVQSRINLFLNIAEFILCLFVLFER